MKRKNKYLLTIIGMVFLLFISGCSVPGLGGDEEESGFSLGGGKSNSGGSGVAVTFDDNNPPSEMIKGQPANFGFIFTNYQTHEITDLKIRTSGFDTGYVKGLNKDYNIGKIPKATETTGPGYYSGFKIQGVKVDGFSQKYNFNPKFDYCYTAKTTYTQQICVPSKKNICEINIDNYKNQNGPLAVTIDRITGFEDKIRLDFKIQNSNSGQVVNQCFKTDDYANKYSKPIVKLGSTTGSCEAVSGEEIVNGKSSFYCEFSRTGEDSYASQVTVEFNYLYQQSLKKEIVVKDLNNGY